MVKQTIKIHSIEEKEGKSGSKYFLVKTDKGNMSCFPDYDGLEVLKQAYVKGDEIEVNVETSDDGKFQNIRKEKANSLNNEQNQRANTLKQSLDADKTNWGLREYEKCPVGLAIEIYNNFGYQPTAKELEEGNGEEVKILMSHAIKLVKQAREAF